MYENLARGHATAYVNGLQACGSDIAEFARVVRWVHQNKGTRLTVAFRVWFCFAAKFA